jgi:hypothetical protein
MVRNPSMTRSWGWGSFDEERVALGVAGVNPGLSVERSVLLELCGDVPLQAGATGVAGLGVLEHAASRAGIVAARSASAVFFIIGSPVWCRSRRSASHITPLWF